MIKNVIQNYIKKINTERTRIFHSTEVTKGFTCCCSRGPNEKEERTSPITSKGVIKFWNCFMKVSWKLPWSSVFDSSEVRRIIKLLELWKIHISYPAWNATETRNMNNGDLARIKFNIFKEYRPVGKFVLEIPCWLFHNKVFNEFMAEGGSVNLGMEDMHH